MLTTTLINATSPKTGKWTASICYSLKDGSYCDVVAQKVMVACPMNRNLKAIAFTGLASVSSVCQACPFCASSNGQLVREAIGSDLIFNAAAMLAPFLVIFICIFALARYGTHADRQIH